MKPTSSLVRPARARPPGRAQQAEPDRTGKRENNAASHASAGAAGALSTPGMGDGAVALCEVGAGEIVTPGWSDRQG
jgi:hypothetical protein